MDILKRLQEIEARKMEIRNLLGTDKNVDLDKLETELRELQSEKENLEKKRTANYGSQPILLCESF